MQMPERARIRALKEEVIKHIEENNVRNFPGCEGKLFLISTAYPGVWLEHAYDAVSYANYTPEGRQVLAGEMRLFLDRQREDGQLPWATPQERRRRGLVVSGVDVEVHATEL